MEAPSKLLLTFHHDPRGGFPLFSLYGSSTQDGDQHFDGNCSWNWCSSSPHTIEKRQPMEMKKKIGETSEVNPSNIQVATMVTSTHRPFKLVQKNPHSKSLSLFSILSPQMATVSSSASSFHFSNVSSVFSPLFTISKNRECINYNTINLCLI